MILQKLRKTIFYCSFLLLSGGVGYWFGQREIAVKWQSLKPEVLIVNKAVPAENKDINFSLFWEVWDKLEKEYLDESAVNKQKMFYGAISGLTAALGDPYTVFLPPQKQEESREELSGEFGGVGIQLGFKEDRLVVIAPLDETPAKLAGIEAGDFILEIKKGIIPLEVKCKPAISDDDKESIVNFISDKSSVKFGILTTEDTLELRDKIMFIPYTLLSLLL